MEARLECPGGLVPVDGGLGNRRRDLDFQGNMVRSGASKGGEDGIREDGIPSKIDECPVNTLQSGAGSPVRPSELAIDQRQLDEGEVVDSIIEGISFPGSEVVVILFMSKPNHVKIIAEKPKNPISRGDLFEFLHKDRSGLWGRWGINVCNADRQIRRSFSKIDRQSGRRGDVMSAREGVGPSRQETTCRAGGRQKAVVIQGTWHERRKLSRSKIRQLGFLKQHQMG
jgi:hypothetical protein